MTEMLERALPGACDADLLLDGYVSLLHAVWGSEAEAVRLADDPKAYAIEKGLPVEADATVLVDDSPHAGTFTKAEIVDGWTGTPGVHVLYVPAAPALDLGELEDPDLDPLVLKAITVKVSVSVSW